MLLWVYAISDTHLGHKNIIDYSNRPFSDLDEMHQVLLDNWNKTVKPDELVIHLGDVCFKPSVGDEFFRQCNGRKILIRGNHDNSYTDTRFKKMGFEEIYHGPQVLICNTSPTVRYILSHEPVKDIPFGFINIHGHVHEGVHRNHEYGFINTSGKHMNFSCENIDYTPRTICTMESFTELIGWEEFLARRFGC